MCKHGDTVPVVVTIPSDLSHTGKMYKRKMLIDRCIAPLVGALERGGILMRGSCCGHGKAEGYISLGDGRYLLIFETREEAVRRRFSGEDS